ncbi:hypothetical protein GX645_03015 [Candidatus Sumerlaeota bacterium]|nr:hypothetical protein [Candidatus Sumerlaeota bacterium]
MEILWGLCLFIPIVLCVFAFMGQWRRWPLAALALWLPTVLPFVNSLFYATTQHSFPLWCWLPICYLPLGIVGLWRAPSSTPLAERVLSLPARTLRHSPLIALCGGSILLLTFAAALAPEVRGDSIIYHISAAMLFSVNERMIEIPNSILTYIPQAQQMLYSVCLDAHSETLARLFHWFSGILLVAGTYEIARQILKLSKKLSLCATLLLLLVPVWTYLATSTYVDLATAVWTLAAFYILLLRPEVDNLADRKSILIAGLLAGAAISTKYTAILTGLLPLCAVLVAQQFERIARKHDTVRSAIAKILLFAAMAFIVFSPWLVRNYIWTGNPVCPSFMSILGPSSVPPETLVWGDIQPGPKYTALATNVWTLLATMFWSLSEFGNYLPTLALILALMCFVTDRRHAFPRPVKLIIIFLVTAYILGVPTGALRSDSRYIMAHVGLLAILCVYWFQFLYLACPQYQKQLMRLATGGILLMLLAYGRTTILMFYDLNEKIIPPVTQNARDEYRAQRLRNYAASMKLAQSEFARNEYDNGKILGVCYPARMNYVLGGQPISPTAALPEPDGLRASDVPLLYANNIRWVFGQVPQEAAALLEPRLTIDEETLYAVPQR